ncbi:MAG: class I SAM-dependent methyltransferase [Thermoplasmata archaeon]|nr:class I SAM-dependent methyltransferase [Thermoplasmata archaeon]
MSWKIKAQKMLNKKQYDAHMTKADRDYTPCTPYGYSTFSPWFEDWFQEMYAKVKDNTVVREDRCYILHRFCQRSTHLEGDFAECGVYKGGTAYLLAHTLQKEEAEGRRLHLFDTFQGMPDIADEDPSTHKEGDLGDVSLDAIKSYLNPFPFVEFHPGFIPETLRPFEDRKFAFAHIDVDLYQTSKDCCDFFYDRMVSGGVMIFDDYGFPGYKLAEKKAVDEFFADKIEEPISLRTGQCIVIKL